MHLLIVEDDFRLASVMKRVLEDEGHVVDLASNGADGLDLALIGDFDAITLDVMLPKLDGFEVCRGIRSAGKSTPVLMLTSREGLQDRVLGLNSGADDYLAKPFAFEELMARLRALGRRRAPLADEVLIVADLVLDEVNHEVRRGKRAIDLTPKEFALLDYLMRHKDRAVTRQQIFDQVWGYEVEVLSNVVDIYVHYLRRKVDRVGAKLIHTIRGVGYKIGESA
jgi:two-component system, OmpR family, response regulator